MGKKVDESVFIEVAGNLGGNIEKAAAHLNISMSTARRYMQSENVQERIAQKIIERMAPYKERVLDQGFPMLLDCLEMRMKNSLDSKAVAAARAYWDIVKFMLESEATSALTLTNLENLRSLDFDALDAVVSFFFSRVSSAEDRKRIKSDLHQLRAEFFAEQERGQDHALLEEPDESEPTEISDIVAKYAEVDGG